MKLDYKKTFYIGLAFFIITIFWQTYDSIITKILIDKFGLNQTWSGVVMALDNVLALFMLPLFGALSDKSNRKRGRRTPYIIVGTIVAAFAFMGLSYMDSVQTTRITATNIDELYAANRDVNVDRLEIDYWNMLVDEMTAERDAALADDTITPARYDQWESKVLNRVNLILDGRTTGSLAVSDLSYLDGYYNIYLSDLAWEVTIANPFNFIVFVAVLLIALIFMSIFRSPAVALMPDVTMKPLRSKANAVINLMGASAGVTALIILTVFGLGGKSYVHYTMAFITVGIVMLIVLAIFLWKVKEPKMVAERVGDDQKWGLTEEEDDNVNDMGDLPRDKKISLYLILFSVFLWFMGYNAVMTKVSDYAPKILQLASFTIPLLIANVTAIIAFIPIGILSTKFGRRKTILFGIVLLTLCFGSVFFLNHDTGWIMYIIFGLTGIGWATINVNSYPMVVELAKGSNVGRYTGYYYSFSMAAQIVTPILSGFLMDTIHQKMLFPYATFFVALAFITMFLTKHGDSKAEKKSLLESFDVDMD